MADEQRDEKPTQRRLERARKEGDFPASREFLSSVHFLGFVAIAVTFSGTFLMRTARMMRSLLIRAFTLDLTPREVVSLMREVVAPAMEPVLAAGIALMLLVVFIQLASTRMGI
jgi:flagellar biosynthesis protein FlhB